MTTGDWTVKVVDVFRDRAKNIQTMTNQLFPVWFRGIEKIRPKSSQVAQSSSHGRADLLRQGYNTHITALSLSDTDRSIDRDLQVKMAPKSTEARPNDIHI